MSLSELFKDRKPCQWPILAAVIAQQLSIPKPMDDSIDIGTFIGQNLRCRKSQKWRSVKKNFKKTPSKRGNSSNEKVEQHSDRFYIFHGGSDWNDNRTASVMSKLLDHIDYHECNFEKFVGDEAFNFNLKEVAKTSFVTDLFQHKDIYHLFFDDDIELQNWNKANETIIEILFRHLESGKELIEGRRR